MSRGLSSGIKFNLFLKMIFDNNLFPDKGLSSDPPRSYRFEILETVFPINRNSLLLLLLKLSKMNYSKGQQNAQNAENRCVPM